MKDLISYDDLVRADMARSAAEKEAQAEVEAAIVLRSTTYSDLFHPENRPAARSVASQFNKWVESGEAPDARELSVCFNARHVVSRFRDYILTKYKNNARERAKWEALFANKSFSQDVLRFVWQKAFEAKAELQDRGETGFRTAIGLEYYVRQKWEKDRRSLVHEVYWRGHKVAADNPNTRADEVARMLLPWLSDKLREHEERLVGHLAERARLMQARTHGLIASDN